MDTARDPLSNPPLLLYNPSAPPLTRGCGRLTPECTDSGTNGDRIWTMFESMSKVLLIAVTLCCLTTTAWAQKAADKSSPFEAVRWNDDAPEVKVGGVWYRPVAIEGIDVEEILTFCTKKYGSRDKKRFGEDLPPAIKAMGHPPLPNRVELRLIRLDDGEDVTLHDVPSTIENRRAILLYNRSNGIGNPPRSSRTSRPSKKWITYDEAVADLVELQDRLDDQFAYRHLRDVDLEVEIARIQLAMDGRVDVEQLTGQLRKLMMRFGDGHAGVRSEFESRPPRYTPFLLGEVDGGIVAFTPDRSRLLEAYRPYLLAIDGVPMDELIDTMRPVITDGSPQLIRARALRELRTLDLVPNMRRTTRNYNTITCTMGDSPEDPDPVELKFSFTDDRPIYGDWPRRSSGLLEGNLGYLRIEAMDDELVPGIRQAMDEFRNTDGLIVDVRGNGGGTRLPLITLAGYLLGPDESPWVANVARYRLSDRFGEGHLEARYMHRADDARWTDAQRRAITELAADFEPEWDRPDGFSPWHYLVLDRTGADGEYFYDRPVVILSDANCFSATDIFLGAFSGRPRITLMGSASGGGSARSQRFELPNSGIQVRCASMASFRPDGRLYDGRGIEVDIEVPLQPADHLLGGHDTVLDAAIEHLTSK